MTLDLSRQDIDHILHYAHWMPVRKGITQAFLKDKYPGWTLGGFKEVFDRAQILLKTKGHPGWRCHWNLQVFTINDDLTFNAVWNEPAVKDDGLFLGVSR